MDNNEYEDAYEYYEDDDGWNEEDDDSMLGWNDWNYGCDYEDF